MVEETLDERVAEGGKPEAARDCLEVGLSGGEATGPQPIRSTTALVVLGE